MSRRPQLEPRSLAWGKVVHEEVYEDTLKVVAFDEYLARQGQAPAQA